MKPVEFYGQTHLFGPPEGWNETSDIKCGVLPLKYMNADGVDVCVSCWKPTEKDISLLKQGALVVITVCSDIDNVTPMCVGVEHVMLMP